MAADHKGRASAEHAGSSMSAGSHATDATGQADAEVAGGAWTAQVQPSLQDTRVVQRFEVWTGGDATATATSVYGGLTTSLSGDIRTAGFVLRTAGGLGLYRYTRSYWNGQQKVWPQFRGVMSYADLLVGYQHVAGPWTLKLFAGAAHEHHDVAAANRVGLLIDDENAVQGGAFGFKGALESWLDLTPAAFAHLDANWSQPFQSYGGRLRLGYRLSAALSTGVEAALHGNTNHDAGRAGAFLRFEWARGEISGSAGGAGTQDELTGAYGSLGLLYRF